jgi:hypothetical protein
MIQPTGLVEPGLDDQRRPALRRDRGIDADSRDHDQILWSIASRAFVPPCIHWMSPNGPQLSDQSPDDTTSSRISAGRNPSRLNNILSHRVILDKLKAQATRPYFLSNRAFRFMLMEGTLKRFQRNSLTFPAIPYMRRAASPARPLGIWGTDLHDCIARRTVIAALLHPRGALVASLGNRSIGHQMPIAQIDVKTMPCNVKPAGEHYGTLIAS